MRKPMRKVTLEDIAVRLGVSRSTVSRALRDDPQIAAATREQAHRLAGELGYVPNAAARALNRRSAGTVGLLLPRSSRFVFTNPYFSELLLGASSVAEDAGYPLLLSTGPRPAFERWLREGRVDGAVLLGSSVPPEDLPRLDALLAAGYPLALVHAPPGPTRVPTLGSDERDGIRQALEHLASAGHRRAAFLAGPAGVPYARRRVEAYREWAARFGLDPEPALVRPTDDTRAGGAAAVRALLADGTPFDAVLGDNDEVALGAIGALGEAGLRVPDDVSVIGFDDTPVAAVATPALTTVRQPVRELGEAAMRTLLALLGGARAAPSRLLPTRLVVRGSARSPPADPPPEHGSADGPPGPDPPRPGAPWAATAPGGDDRASPRRPSETPARTRARDPRRTA